MNLSAPDANLGAYVSLVVFRTEACLMPTVQAESSVSRRVHCLLPETLGQHLKQGRSTRPHGEAILRRKFVPRTTEWNSMGFLAGKRGPASQTPRFNLMIT